MFTAPIIPIRTATYLAHSPNADPPAGFLQPKSRRSESSVPHKSRNKPGFVLFIARHSILTCTGDGFRLLCLFIVLLDENFRSNIIDPQTDSSSFSNVRDDRSHSSGQQACSDVFPKEADLAKCNELVWHNYGEYNIQYKLWSVFLFS